MNEIQRFAVYLNLREELKINSPLIFLYLQAKEEARQLNYSYLYLF